MVFCEGGHHPDHTHYVVMTEKVLVDNPKYSQTEIELLIQQALMRPGWVNTGLHIVWVPWDTSDTCGHTDGMLHYVGVNAAGRPIVLVHLDGYDDEYAARVYEILSQYFEVVKLRLSHPNEHSWAYVNMLHMRDVMIVPGIGDEVTDREAFEQIRALFPQYEGRIYQVQMQKLVARWGGALNCCTWTISREMSSVVHSATNAAKYEALITKAEADEQNLTTDEMNFLGDYAPLQLERISHFIDTYYWGW
jgi:agmatine/peptidylarginine deiminase